MNRHLNNLMHKEMSRKEFLTMIGLGLMSIFGLSTLFNLLTGKQAPRGGLTYGGSSYGKKLRLN